MIDVFLHGAGRGFFFTRQDFAAACRVVVFVVLIRCVCVFFLSLHVRTFFFFVTRLPTNTFWLCFFLSCLRNRFFLFWHAHRVFVVCFFTVFLLLLSVISVFFFQKQDICRTDMFLLFFIDVFLSFFVFFLCNFNFVTRMPTNMFLLLIIAMIP